MCNKTSLYISGLPQNVTPYSGWPVKGGIAVARLLDSLEGQADLIPADSAAVESQTLYRRV